MELVPTIPISDSQGGRQRAAPPWIYICACVSRGSRLLQGLDFIGIRLVDLDEHLLHDAEIATLYPLTRPLRAHGLDLGASIDPLHRVGLVGLRSFDSSQDVYLRGRF